jgi:hypothetical protein
LASDRKVWNTPYIRQEVYLTSQALDWMVQNIFLKDANIHLVWGENVGKYIYILKV